MAKSNKTSPLKDRPLHNPGQSLDVRLDDLLVHKVLLPIVMAGMLIALASTEWLRWYWGTPPHPFFYTLAAAGFVIYVAFAVWRIRTQVRAIKLGRDGERAVGQYLEQLRESGARVFHDIVGNGFNLDHVVLTTQGIFVVETKTWRKPSRGEAHITFDGTQVLAAGHKPDRDPVRQVVTQAAWLRELLKESTGKAFPVKPVIVFPGWFVEAAATGSAKRHGVRLLNPKALPSFIAAEPDQCGVEEVKLAAYHLSRYIRAMP